VEEASCEDFGEAVDACESNCFKRDADGFVVVMATKFTGRCPAGGCCVNYTPDFSTGSLIFKENRYACGCGWLQTKIRINCVTCADRCTGSWDPFNVSYPNCCSSNPYQQRDREEWCDQQGEVDARISGGGKAIGGK